MARLGTCMKYKGQFIQVCFKLVLCFTSLSYTHFWLLQKNIGLVQRCVRSSILFDCILTSAWLPVSSEKLGSTFKALPEITMHSKAYADDLTLLSKNAVVNQFL